MPVGQAGAALRQRCLPRFAEDPARLARASLQATTTNAAHAATTTAAHFLVIMSSKSNRHSHSHAGGTPGTPSFCSGISLVDAS